MRFYKPMKNELKLHLVYSTHSKSNIQKMSQIKEVENFTNFVTSDDVGK